MLKTFFYILLAIGGITICVLLAPFVLAFMGIVFAALIGFLGFCAIAFVIWFAIMAATGKLD